MLAQITSPTVLEISISDTGRGISSENLPRVKEKFYKTDNTVAGSGIGLAVADEIVKLHGGFGLGGKAKYGDVDYKLFKSDQYRQYSQRGNHRNDNAADRSSDLYRRKGSTR